MGSQSDKKFVKIDEAKIDPNLALLFSSSLPKTNVSSREHDQIALSNGVKRARAKKQKSNLNSKEEIETKLPNHSLTNPPEDVTNIRTLNRSLSKKREPFPGEDSETISHHNERKRKRKTSSDNLEVEYLQKLAKQEDKELKQSGTQGNLKYPKSRVPEEDFEDSRHNDTSRKKENHSSTGQATVPIHESINLSNQSNELEKASRTVFLANVSTLAISSKKARKALLSHMASFLSDLPKPPEGTPPHKVESIRFRSTAYTGSGLTKRAAYAKKKIMEETTKGTNAYVVYSNSYAARAAVKMLNGSVVLDRHLRVDGVAHPSKIDHRRCIFVGNLGFVDDESSLVETDEMSRKRSKIPADIEEGLWRQFNKVGTVESVRVVRDEKTRVGKGFAYVQFTDPNTVEAALLLNEKKFPPMLPRLLRVMRAKPVKKTASGVANLFSKKTKPKPVNSVIFNPKISSVQSSIQGRASKLLGQAGAAKLRSNDSNVANVGHSIDITNKRLSLSSKNPPNGLIFEGHRAKSKSAELRKTKSGGKSLTSKPKTRSSRRASEWRKKNINKAIKN
ncbi:Nucleolar protein 12 [Erysiphe neolycopersici]|uniref:Nucleolar protein 12 n=1 Tax=Erysiphe neolycopersici TaxID=212602 RepID=A0A420HWB3_9PEZI|nr:Nucleolar protein 12 [Erysiphe neolycopersici]